MGRKKLEPVFPISFPIFIGKVEELDTKEHLQKFEFSGLFLNLVVEIELSKKMEPRLDSSQAVGVGVAKTHLFVMAPRTSLERLPSIRGHHSHGLG